MKAFIAVLALSATAVLADKPPPPAPRAYSPAPTYADVPAQYEFQWEVKDDYSKNDYGQQEQRSGDSTKGSYYVALPDGRLQKVSYSVDGYGGFVADVTYEGEAQYEEAASYPRPSYKPAPPPSYPPPAPKYEPAPAPKYEPAPAPKYEPAPAPAPKYEPAPAPEPKYKPAPAPAPEYKPAPPPEPSYQPAAAPSEIYYKPAPQPAESEVYYKPIEKSDEQEPKVYYKVPSRRF